MICYKVVKKRLDSLQSNMVVGQFCLDYQLNTKTVPRVGKILVFETLADARAYNVHGVILKCECDELSKIDLMLNLTFVIGYENVLRNFWDNPDLIDKSSKFGSPLGTYGTNYVIPLEIVE